MFEGKKQKQRGVKLKNITLGAFQLCKFKISNNSLTLYLSSLEMKVQHRLG